LGGLMFSCSGRGPERRSLLREEMADAKRFHKHFPDVNLCGLLMLVAKSVPWPR
jgi:small ligand-binding sensory domain FIST